MKRAWLYILLILIAIVAGIWWWAPVGFLAGSVAEENAVAGLPECPRHDVVWVRDIRGRWTLETQVAGSGSITLIPEYHDCQKLRMAQDTGYTFGSLIAIFVRSHVDSIADPPGFHSLTPPPGSPWLPVVAGVSAPVLPVLPILGEEDGRARAAVTILNYDSRYPQLQIPNGVSCLYVYHAGAEWNAKIAPVETDADCLKPLDSFPDADALRVTPIYDKSPAPVARWDWDAENEEHYIGVRCGSSWCEVWNPDRPSYRSSPWSRPTGKGWYDEQYLAEAGASAEDLVPGAAQATAGGTDFTYSDAVVAEAFTGEWVPLANVSLSVASPTYENKYRYKSGPPPLAETKVEFCKGPAPACIKRGLDRMRTARCENSGDPWWARITSPFGKPKYRCVIRRPHDPISDLPPPGVVRWRWKVKDEGMWSRCPAGCCEKT